MALVFFGPSNVEDGSQSNYQRACFSPATSVCNVEMFWNATWNAHSHYSGCLVPLKVAKFHEVVDLSHARLVVRRDVTFPYHIG